MLELKNINKKYAGNRNNAISNCSYVFPDNGFYLIYGPSGSGKSTLLGILSGIDTSYDGSLLYNNTILNKTNISSYRNAISTIVFQDLNLIDNLCVEDNLRIAFDLNSEKYSKNECIEALKKVNLPDFDEDIKFFLKKKPSQLSGGQKQRIAIARAIIRKSKILFLDEPTSSLDENNANEISKALSLLSKEMLVVLVTHTPEWFANQNIVQLKLENGELDINKTTKIITDNDCKFNLYKNYASTSFRTSLKLSHITLFTNPLRSIFTTLIALVSLISCLFFYSAKTIDSNQVSIKNQLNDGNKLCIIQNNQYEIKNNSKNTYAQCKFTDKQKSVLQKLDAHPIINNDFNYSIYIDEKFSTQQHKLPLLYFMFNSYFSNSFLELWNEDDDEDFIEDERLKENTSNHFPTSFDEIAISSTCANMFLKYGSKKNEFKITDVNELIEKKLFSYKIVNIYTTKDDNNLRLLNTIEDITDSRIKNLFSCFSYSQMLYVAPGFYEYYKTLPKDDDDSGNREAKRLNTLNNETENIYYAFSIGGENDANNKLNSLTDVSGNFIYKPTVLNMYSTRILFDNIMNEKIADYISYVLIIFLLLSLFSLILLFTANHKKQINTYSILKALGCSFLGVLKISLLEATLISTFIFLLTLCSTFLTFNLFNYYLQIELFSINSILFALLLGFILIVIIIITIANILKISNSNISILLKEIN